MTTNWDENIRLYDEVSGLPKLSFLDVPFSTLGDIKSNTTPQEDLVWEYFCKYEDQLSSKEMVELMLMANKHELSELTDILKRFKETKTAQDQL